MNNEKLVEQIDELIGMHRQLKTEGNDILSKVRSVLTKKKSDDYEKGLNDAWELAQRISGSSHPDYYDTDELCDIFGCLNPEYVFDHFSYSEALAKIQEYEKKKAEEEAKPVTGDLVKVVGKYDGSVTYVGVVMSMTDTGISLLTKNYGAVHLCNYNNAAWNITKLNKHFDIEELLEAMDEK